MFDKGRIVPFAHLSDLNFSTPPGSAAMCIDESFFTPKKKMCKDE